MTTIAELSTRFDYDAAHHDFASWWEHHRAMLATCGRRKRAAMVIRNGNQMYQGMSIDGWIAAGGARRDVSSYTTHSGNWPKQPHDARPTPISEYPS